MEQEPANRKKRQNRSKIRRRIREAERERESIKLESIKIESIKLIFIILQEVLDWKMTSIKSTTESRNRLALVAIVLASVAFECSLGQTFFTQPQSHLGRLVQSITSPLIMPSAGASFEGSDAALADTEGAYEQPESMGGSLGPAGQQQAGGQQHFQHYRPAQMASGGGGQQQQQQQQQASYAAKQQNLQQAPSQQRGIPSQNYAAPNSDDNDDESQSEPGADYPSGQAAPRPMGARNGQPNQHFQVRGAEQPAAARANPEYQMGAYLGPTIDDKEIQGAFNSNNDERDDDDGPAGYVGPPASASRASSQMGGGGRSGMGGGGRDESAADEPGDSSSADEDDDFGGQQRPRGAAGGGAYGGLSQAASQFHGRQQQAAAAEQERRARSRANHQQLATAANGYAPYGPVDLSGLLAAANGQQQAGYEVYGGDGSNFGPPMGFEGMMGGQQGGGANGRRQQVASNQFGHSNGPMGYGPAGGQQANANSNNDDDAEADSEDD